MDDADRADARIQCHLCGCSVRYPATLCDACQRVLDTAPGPDVRTSGRPDRVLA